MSSTTSANPMSISGHDGDSAGFHSGAYASLSDGPKIAELARVKDVGKMTSDSNNNTIESMVFEESESLAWKSHHLKRFTEDRTKCVTSSRRSTVYKWILVVMVGALVAVIGLGVKYGTSQLTAFKYNYLKKMSTEKGEWVWAYFSFVSISCCYALVAGVLCCYEPNAAGSGIPQIKAYLNGVNLHKLVRIRTLFAKVVGMVFSVASGLPLGKEGPMIHAGSIVGAAVSQGRGSIFGYDTSWTKYQDLRNDRSKRDFVTFGAAAGVAAAFSAPIGGILFVLEEGASYWSSTLTFRGFFCAMVTELTVNLATTAKNSGAKTTLGLDEPTSMFDFGTFNSYDGYFTYELALFLGIGCFGGLIGAFFNHHVKTLSEFRKRSSFLNSKKKRVLELLLATAFFATVIFVVPTSNQFCSPLPVVNDDDWNSEQVELAQELVQFNCPDGEFNEIASLFLVDADITLQQLFHFHNSTPGVAHSFGVGTLLIFFFSYFFMAIYAAGCYCPAGLFVPTLVSGAAMGRLVGLVLGANFPGQVCDEGTYSLLGAAAILGGMSRMTIAGTIIVLEASGNSEYLLPLMLVFAGARYTGNVFNKAMYDMQIELAELPFLDNMMPGRINLLKYHPVSDIMKCPVHTINEINKVGVVYDLLRNTTHNGFPVIARNGQLRGYIMRKTLCSILKLKAFATPVNEIILEENLGEGVESESERVRLGSFTRAAPYNVGAYKNIIHAGESVDGNSVDGRLTFASARSQSARSVSTGGRSNGANTSESEGGCNNANADEGDHLDRDVRHRIKLNSHNILFFETVERSTYPKYPPIESILLSAADRESWLDVRIYMDPAPHVLHQNSSIQRTYRYFRTMGLRHLIITDNRHRVTGMITREDLTEKSLCRSWEKQRGQQEGEFINAELPQDEYEEFYYVDEDVSTINLYENDAAGGSGGAGLARASDSGEAGQEETPTPSSKLIRVVDKVFPVRELQDLRKWRANTLSAGQPRGFDDNDRKSFYADKELRRERKSMAGKGGHGRSRGSIDEGVAIYVGSVVDYFDSSVENPTHI